jgi:hypothetical protein
VDSSNSTDLYRDLLGIDCSQGCSKKFRYEKMTRSYCYQFNSPAIAMAVSDIGLTYARYP